MKKTLIFSIADEKNLKYEKMFRNSLLKFHPNIDYHLVTGDELNAYLKDDPHFFYRATPIIAEKFINDYELVLKMDCDQIVAGNLDYIFDTKDYDVGTVINWNRIDPQTYGLVGGWGITPVEYMNCGLVAMRSKEFIKQWKKLCFSPQFDRLQYKEQDLLNALIYFGNFNVRCFDHGDGVAKMSAWWGVISKGEWNKAILKGEKIVVPATGDNFPKNDVELKVLHWAGGNDNPEKMNYRTKFSEDIIKRLDFLVSDKVK